MNRPVARCEIENPDPVNVSERIPVGENTQAAVRPPRRRIAGRDAGSPENAGIRIREVVEKIPLYPVPHAATRHKIVRRNELR